MCTQEHGEGSSSSSGIQKFCEDKTLNTRNSNDTRSSGIRDTAADDEAFARLEIKQERTRERAQTAPEKRKRKEAAEDAEQIRQNNERRASVAATIATMAILEVLISRTSYN